jgi:glutamine cyclotransferase
MSGKVIWRLLSIAVLLASAACSVGQTPHKSNPTISLARATRAPASPTPYPPPEMPAMPAYPQPPDLPSTAAALATANPPQLGPGRVPLAPASSQQPAVFTYVCPWLEFAEDLPVYSHEVINTYPHDPQAYTQGLVYADGVMYESTGLYGASAVRIVDLETGQVELSREIPEAYFAEGLALLDGRLFQLTWKEHTGFIYDPSSLGMTGTFAYATEGWGLTDDGQNLIMSDGSDQLYWLSKEDQKTISAVQVRNHETPVTRLNELEFVAGEVWANVYQTSCIARIDPSSGRVKGWIDIGGLLTPEELVAAEVPNGIAYDLDSGRLFITGKYWPRLFEIKVIPANSNAD